MGVVDKGIETTGALIRGDGTAKPIQLSFSGLDASTFDEGKVVLGSEFIRKDVSWGKTGIQSQYTVQLDSTEANGSYINSIGLHTGSVLNGSDLYSYNESFIGSKTSAINVQVEGELIISRFTV